MFCFNGDDNKNFVIYFERRTNLSSAGNQAVTHSEKLKKKKRKKEVTLAAAYLVFGPLSI